MVVLDENSVLELIAAKLEASANGMSYRAPGTQVSISLNDCPRRRKKSRCSASQRAVFLTFTLHQGERRWLRISKCRVRQVPLGTRDGNQFSNSVRRYLRDPARSEGPRATGIEPRTLRPQARNSIDWNLSKRSRRR